MVEGRSFNAVLSVTRYYDRGLSQIIYELTISSLDVGYHFIMELMQTFCV